MIILDKWYGRLGNNICQLLKIIEEYFNQYKNDVILKCSKGFF